MFLQYLLIKMKMIEKKKIIMTIATLYLCISYHEKHTFYLYYTVIMIFYNNMIILCI